MTTPHIDHYPSCQADYPEKPKGEAPRKIITIDIGDGETVFQCVDCGASVVIDSTSVETAGAQK